MALPTSPNMVTKYGQAWVLHQKLRWTCSSSNNHQGLPPSESYASVFTVLHLWRFRGLVHPSPVSSCHTWITYTLLPDLVTAWSQRGRYSLRGAPTASKGLWGNGREANESPPDGSLPGHRRPPMAALQPSPWQQQGLMRKDPDFLKERSERAHWNSSLLTLKLNNRQSSTRRDLCFR